MLPLEEDLTLFAEELDYAFRNVPFFKKHMNKHGLEPKEFETNSDVLAIPITEKRDYRKHFPVGVIAKGYSLDNETLTRSQSSGTTGERLVTFEVGMLLMGRAADCTAIHSYVGDTFEIEGKKICRYAAPNCSDVECANPNSTMEDRLLSDGTLVLPVYHDLLTTSDVLIERALNEIIEYQPDLYLVDPTHFAFLVRHAKQRGITLPNAPIIATYSATTQLNRKQISDYFSQDMIYTELVASSEMGWLGLECDFGHVHFNTDAFFIELIKEGRHAKIGEVAELVISSIDNGAIPHIRYKTGDIFSIQQQFCSCGHPSPVVQMEGRISDFLNLGEGKWVSPRQIDTIFGSPEWLELYQVHQLSISKFVVSLVTNASYMKGYEKNIVKKLEVILGKNIDCELKLVNYIVSERSGKLQFVKTDVPLEDSTFQLAKTECEQ